MERQPGVTGFACTVGLGPWMYSAVPLCHLEVQANHSNGRSFHAFSISPPPPENVPLQFLEYAEVLSSSNFYDKDYNLVKNLTDSNGSQKERVLDCFDFACVGTSFVLALQVTGKHFKTLSYACLVPP